MLEKLKRLLIYLELRVPWRLVTSSFACCIDLASDMYLLSRPQNLQTMLLFVVLQWLNMKIAEAALKKFAAGAQSNTGLMDMSGVAKIVIQICVMRCTHCNGHAWIIQLLWLH